MSCGKWQEEHDVPVADEAMVRAIVETRAARMEAQRDMPQGVEGFARVGGPPYQAPEGDAPVYQDDGLRFNDDPHRDPPFGLCATCGLEHAYPDDTPDPDLAGDDDWEADDFGPDVIPDTEQEVDMGPWRLSDVARTKLDLDDDYDHTVPGAAGARRFDVSGVGKDALIEEGAHGGRQSRVEADFTQLDPFVMLRGARILYDGAATHGRDNWKKIPIDEHLNHLLMHVYAYLADDRRDDHLGHAFVRAMMALSLELAEEDQDAAAVAKFEQMTPLEKIKYGLARRDAA